MSSFPLYVCNVPERVVVEGEVATANTLARLLSSLPPCGKTTRVMLYDLHTLQNRFYLSNHSVATLHRQGPTLCADETRKGVFRNACKMMIVFGAEVGLFSGAM